MDEKVVDHLLEIGCGALQLAGEIGEFAPFVGPVFKMASGVLGLVKVCRGINEPTEMELLNSINIKIDTIWKNMKAELESMDVNVDYRLKYSEVLTCIEKYKLTDKKDEDDLVKALVGLNVSLREKIDYICMKSSDSDIFDATWGSKLILTEFMKVYILQVQALKILKEHDDFDELCEYACQHFDLFSKKFMEHWHQTIKHTKKVKLLYDQEYCYGDMSVGEDGNAFFIRLVKSKNKKESTLQRLYFAELTDQTKKEKKVQSEQEKSIKIRNYEKRCAVYIYEEKLYTIECSSNSENSGRLRCILTETHTLDDSFCCETSFLVTTQIVVCQKERFLYALNDEKELCAIDLNDCKNTEPISDEKWSKFAIVEDKIYAIKEGQESDLYCTQSKKRETEEPILEQQRWSIENDKDGNAISFESVKGMIGHGNCLYVVDNEGMKVFDTDSKELEHWPVEDLKLYNKNELHLMSLKSTICMQINTKKKLKFYLIKPYWHFPLPQLEASGTSTAGSIVPFRRAMSEKFETMLNNIKPEDASLVAASFRKYSNQLLDALQQVDLKILLNQAMRMQLISEVVYKSFDNLSFNPSASSSLKIKYLLLHVCEGLKEKFYQCKPWFEVLRDNAVRIRLLTQIIEDGSTSRDTISHQDDSVNAITITRQPGSIEVPEKKSVLLDVETAESVNDISYQWMKDGTLLDGGSNEYLGTNMPILCVNGATLASSGSYKCKLTVTGCSDPPKESEPIELTVMASREKESLMVYYSNMPSNLGEKITYADLILLKDSDGLPENTIQDNDDSKTKKEITYTKAFQCYESGLKLIEGRPGSGKTTLVNKLVKDWAKPDNIILKGADFVFLVSLGVLPEGKKLDLSDILKDYYNDIEHVAMQAVNSRGEGMCFILDGLDEYPMRDEINIQPFKLHYNGEIKHLDRAMVIVTSRPVATALLRDNASVCIEVKGFSEQQIRQYVKNFPFSIAKEEEKEKLITHLVDRSNVLNTCFLPFNAFMVCSVYNELSKLPETDSEIYMKFTLLTLLRKADEKSMAKEFLDTLQKLGKKLESEEDYLKFLFLFLVEYKEEEVMQLEKKIYSLQEEKRDVEWKNFREKRAHFKSICKTAFDMTVSCKTVLRDDKLKASISSDLGLITIKATKGRLFEKSLYSFVHLTFQEYLAACHLSILSQEEQIKILGEYCNKDNMQMVIKFFCGLYSVMDRKCLFDEIVKSHKDHLFLCHCAFESKGQTMCHCLVNEKRNGILLQNQSIKPLDFAAINFVVLETVSCLKKLAVCNCNLGEDPGVFFDCLNQLVNLKSLTLSGDMITDQKAKKLACNSLNFLDLSVNRISDIQLLCPKLDNLTSLNLSLNRIGNESAQFLSETLKSTKYLESLHLEWNYLNDEGISLLAQGLESCTELEYLFLDGNKIGEDYAEEFSDKLLSCTKLKVLSLSSSGITDYGAIDISFCFFELTCLETLNFNNNSIGNVGAQEIATGILNLKNLQVLKLDDNHIGDHGAKVLGDALKDKKNFESLYISFNELQRGAGMLANCLGIEKVHLSGSNLDLASGDEMFREWRSKESKPLKKIVIPNCGIKNEIVVSMSDSFKHNRQSLSEIDMTFNFIHDRGIEEISEWMKCSKCLTKIFLSHNLIEKEGAIALAKGLKPSKNIIQTLFLGYNTIGADGAGALSKAIKCCKNLQLIDLRSNSIGNKGAEALAESLKSCDNINSVLLSNNEIDDNGAKHLAENLKELKHLRVLHLDYNKITGYGACLLTENLKECRELDMEKNEIGGSGAFAMAKHTNVDTLYLNGIKLGNQGAKEFSKGLKFCGNVRILTLASNEILDDGATAISDTLWLCKSLKILDLSNNNIGKGIIAIARSLRYCQSLSELNLSRNKIGNSGAKVLGDCLNHRILEILVLDKNQIGDSGATGLSIGLSRCVKLQVLNLYSNHICDVGAASLGEGLSKCTHLRRLELQANIIGNDGAESLGKGLRNCTSLEGLYVRDNKIGDAGAASLGESLCHCTDLVDLDLRYNPISNLCDVKKSLKGCKNLTIF